MHKGKTLKKIITSNKERCSDKDMKQAQVNQYKILDENEHQNNNVIVAGISANIGPQKEIELKNAKINEMK